MIMFLRGFTILLVAALLLGCGSDRYESIHHDLLLGNFAEAEVEVKRHLFDNPEDLDAGAYLMATRLLQSFRGNAGQLDEDEINVIAVALLLEAEDFRGLPPEQAATAEENLRAIRTSLRHDLRQLGVRTSTFDDVHSLANKTAAIINTVFDDQMRRAASLAPAEEELLEMALMWRARSGDRRAASSLVARLGPNDGHNLVMLGAIVGRPLLRPIEDELAQVDPLLPRRMLQRAHAWINIIDKASAFASEYPDVRRVRETDLSDDYRAWWRERARIHWTRDLVPGEAHWNQFSMQDILRRTGSSTPLAAVDISYHDGLSDNHPHPAAADDESGLFMIQAFNPESRSWVMRFYFLNGTSLTRLRSEASSSDDVQSREPVSQFAHMFSDDLIRVALPSRFAPEDYVVTERRYNRNTFQYETVDVTRQREVELSRYLSIPVARSSSSFGEVAIVEEEALDI